MFSECFGQNQSTSALGLGVGPPAFVMHVKFQERYCVAAPMQGSEPVCGSSISENIALLTDSHTVCSCTEMVLSDLLQQFFLQLLQKALSKRKKMHRLEVASPISPVHSNK